MIYPWRTLAISRDNLLKILFISFLERGEGREKEGGKHQCVVASHMVLLGTWPATHTCAPTGNQTSDHLVRRPALSPQSHTSQGSKDIFGCHNWRSYYWHLVCKVQGRHPQCTGQPPSATPTQQRPVCCKMSTTLRLGITSLNKDRNTNHILNVSFQFTNWRKS